MNVHLTHGYDALQKIRFFGRIRLMDDALVAFTGCTRLICINTRNDK